MPEGIYQIRSPEQIDAKRSSERNPARFDVPMTRQVRTRQEENELIRLIGAGEKEFFYALVKPYERAVYSTAFGVLGNHADAEDVAQEVFLKALKNLAGFRAEAKFSTWLIQIAFNEARMFLRRSRRKQYQSLDASQENTDGDYIPKDFADWRDIPSEALARKELRDAIARCVCEMKEIYQETLILRDMRHMSVRETAEMLGVSQEVVKTRLLRARLQLRDALAPGYDGSWSREEKGYKKVRPW